MANTEPPNDAPDENKYLCSECGSSEPNSDNCIGYCSNKYTERED